ncbi:MAG TPA: hypothetical protein VF181_02300 [Balneolaceae bacterium]
MYSFFLNRSSKRDVVNKLSVLPLQFSAEQKSAIVVSLLALAKVDGFIPDKRFFYLERLLALLKIEENSWLFKEIYNAGLEKSLTILRELWDNQKEWYVMMLYGLMRMDNKASNRKEILQICDEIGISKQRYQKITHRF